MAAENCIKAIRDAAGFDLTDDQVEQILTEIDRRAKAKKAAGQLETLEDRMLEAADDMARDIEEASLIEKRNRLINIRKEAELRRFIRDVEQATGDPSLALRAKNVGVKTPFAGARDSVDARGKAMFSEYMGGIIADLERERLLPVLNSRQLDREIAGELWELSLGKKGRPGVSGSAEARKIADIVDKYRKASMARENRAGAWKKRTEGFVVSQTHDMHRMRRAGFEAWRDAILPRLDFERTFAGVDDPEKFLKGAYDGLVTGIHLKANGAAENDLQFAFKGPANLAKKVSQHRVLHFKSADDWMDYSEAFGTRSLTEAIVQDFERSARNTALMEAYGTNPRAMFEKMRSELAERNRGELKKFDAINAQKVGWEFDEIEGVTRMPVNATWAQHGAMVRAVQSMAKLGGATLSAISDVAFKASEMRYQGKGFLDSWSRSLTTLIDGMAPGEGRITAALIGVGMEGQIGSMASRFSATDSLSGKMAKLQQLFFKLNLLSPLTDGHQRGMGLMMAHDLAMKSTSGWDDLDVPTTRLLSMYGIDGARWDVLRQAVRADEAGTSFMMPDAVRDLPDEVFAGLVDKPSSRNIARIKDDLETALRSYIVDRVSFAVPTPGAAELSVLRFGTRPGTPLGEAVRFVMQFKAFPVTAISKPFGTLIYGHGARNLGDALLRGQGDILGIVHLMASATIMGYVAQSAKELAKGKSPRDPASPDTMVAAFLQGGAAGIYGDFLFGEFNRFGRSALATAAGPTFGTVDDVFELWARTIRGEDAGASGLRFLQSNMPFANLFYTKAAIDYLFLYQIQEAMNPGYLRRMERRIEKDNAQRFLFPPSQQIPRGGGSRLFEGVR